MKTTQNRKSTIEQWLSMMARIIGQDPPEPEMVDLYSSTFAGVNEKDLKRALSKVAASHQFGQRYPLPSEILDALETHHEEPIARAPDAAPSELSLKCFRLLIQWLGNKSERIWAELQATIEAMPETVYQCMDCKDSGLIQIWGYLEDWPHSWTVTEKKELPFDRHRTYRKPNSPTWTYLYPDLIKTPDPAATMMVAKCHCKFSKYSFPRQEERI